MFVDKTVKPWKVVFIVNNSGIWVLVRRKISEIFCFLLSELNTWMLKKPFHFLNFNIPFSFRVQKSKCGKNCLWLIRLKFLFFEDSQHVRFEFGVLNGFIGLIFLNLLLVMVLLMEEWRLWLELRMGTGRGISWRMVLLFYQFGFSFCRRKGRTPHWFSSWGNLLFSSFRSLEGCYPRAFSFCETLNQIEINYKCLNFTFWKCFKNDRIDLNDIN